MAMNKTQLLLQYFERTRNFDLPDHIEEALEEDYVLNSALYTDAMFKRIRLVHLLCPDSTPAEMLRYVRNTSAHD
jgi:hypothetical protein